MGADLLSYSVQEVHEDTQKKLIREVKATSQLCICMYNCYLYV